MVDLLPRPKMGKAYPKEVLNRAQALYVAGVPPLRIQRETGVKAATVQTWVSRYGWQVGRDALTGLSEKAVDSTIQRTLDARSSELQDVLSAELLRNGEILRRSPQKGLKGILERIQVGKLLVEAADKLFGWSKDGGPRCLVQIGTLNQLSETPQQVVSCGVPEAGVVDITEDKPAETGLSG